MSHLHDRAREGRARQCVIRLPHHYALILLIWWRFSGYQLSRSANRHHRGAVYEVDRVRNGTIFCAAPLPRVSTPAYRSYKHAAESLLIHRCKRSTFVDRPDFDNMKILVCPLPDCPHIWCKACQQPIDLGGVQHSCDGTSELDSLMKERGWKYCPSLFVLSL